MSCFAVLVVGFFAMASLVGVAEAFTIHAHTTAAGRLSITQQQHVPKTLLRAIDPNNSNPMDGLELTSQLASLDQEWKLQQEAEGAGGRWTKLIVSQQEPNYESLQDYVYLLEPPAGKPPSSVILFLGGAGLGQFPQVAYNEFLTRVSDKLNAAVITAPYQVGLDHFSLSKDAGERLRKAVEYCQQARGYSPQIPTYCLGHSLGCKLQTIYVAATGKKYDGLGFLAYNNFSFSQTMSMAKDFADQMQGGSSSVNSRRTTSQQQQGSDLMSTIFGVAELAIGAIGLDFSPTQAEMNRLIQVRYDDANQSKTRLFVFDDDTLDSSRSFVHDCKVADGPGPTVSGLPGNHLTPVFFPQSAAASNSDASFGKEIELDALVNEVCDWIGGSDPSRGPSW